MNPPPTPDWLVVFLGWLDAAQAALRRLFHAVGLAGSVHGQPAWPLPWRVANETLLIDLYTARGLAISLGLAGLALLLCLAALAWRRARAVLLASAVAAVALAPWPSASLVLAQAVPTSLHAAPLAFGVDQVRVGAAVYAAHCVGCHGVRGDGAGALAAGLQRRPPSFAGGLLGRRLEGELLWRVLHGMRGPRGQETMPGLAPALSDGEAWAALDYLKALAAGLGAARTGAWPSPVRVPDMTVRCDEGPPERLAALSAGQRVRFVAAGTEQVREDPRLLTIAVAREDAVARPGETAAIACRARSDAAWDALALIAGVDAARLAGTQFLGDRNGWLRARASGAWRDEDFLCTAGGQRDAAASGAAAAGDGLSALIARMDAEPVRYVRGGVAH